VERAGSLSVSGRLVSSRSERSVEEGEDL
jgi:hypothetical protein